jgi:YVTN family beta-propeller protein
VGSRRDFLASAPGLAAAFASCSTNTKKAFDGYAFVATRDSGDIAIVDLAAFALEKRIKTAAKPVQLLDLPAPHHFLAVTEAGDLQEVDSAKGEVSRSAPFKIFPGELHLSHDASLLWALSPDARRLLAISREKLTIEREWKLNRLATHLAVSPESPHVAVSYEATDQVSLLAAPSAATLTHASTTKTAGRIRFLKNGSVLLVAQNATRDLTLVDTQSARVIVHLPLPLEPENLCFSADGGQLFLTGKGLDAVVVVYPFQSQVATTLLAGKAPGPMAVSAAPPFLFVTSPTTDTVSVLDIRSQKLVAVVAVGSEPRNVAITPDNSMALVLNQRSGDIAIIRLANIVSKRNKTAPLFTMIPVGSAPVAAIVRST